MGEGEEGEERLMESCIGEGEDGSGMRASLSMFEPLWSDEMVYRYFGRNRTAMQFSRKTTVPWRALVNAVSLHSMQVNFVSTDSSKMRQQSFNLCASE